MSFINQSILVAQIDATVIDKMLEGWHNNPLIKELSHEGQLWPWPGIILTAILVILIPPIGPIRVADWFQWLLEQAVNIIYAIVEFFSLTLLTVLRFVLKQKRQVRKDRLDQGSWAQEVVQNLTSYARYLLSGLIPILFVIIPIVFLSNLFTSVVNQNTWPVALYYFANLPVWLLTRPVYGLGFFLLMGLIALVNKRQRDLGQRTETQNQQMQRQQEIESAREKQQKWEQEQVERTELLKDGIYSYLIEHLPMAANPKAKPEIDRFAEQFMELNRAQNAQPTENQRKTGFSGLLRPSVEEVQELPTPQPPNMSPGLNPINESESTIPGLSLADQSAQQFDNLPSQEIPSAPNLTQFNLNTPPPPKKGFRLPRFGRRGGNRTSQNQPNIPPDILITPPVNDQSDDNNSQ